MNKTNLILIFALILVTGFYAYSWYKNSQFPVEYLICGQTYTDCFVSAKFKNLRDCEVAKEMGNWLCDWSDLNDIKCKVSTNSSAVGLCRN